MREILDTQGFNPEEFTFDEESPETKHNNPYVDAGFKTGDVVWYQWEDRPEEVLDIEIADGGAWLLRYESQGLVKATKNPSTHPEKCKRYNFISSEIAKARYDELLKSPFIKTKDDLFELFDAVARSMVTPSDLGMTNYTETDEKGLWVDLKKAVNDVEGNINNPSNIASFTRDHNLRAKIIEIFNVTQAEEKDTIPKEDERIEKNDNEYESLKISNPEKRALFNKLEIGQHIVIGNRSFRKASNELYVSSHSRGYNNDGTMVQSVMKREDLINIINIPLIKSSEISILVENQNQKQILLESPEKLAFVEENFKDIADSLFPRGQMNRDIIKELIRNSEVEQGQYGDCYLLAAINSIKKTNPQLYLQTLERTLSKGDNPGEWKVNFQGSDVGEIIVKEASLKDWKKSGAKAELADIILERAYVSEKSRRKHGNEGMSMAIDHKKRLAFEGGFGHRALEDILGSGIAEKHIIADYERADGTMNLIDNEKAGIAEDFLNNEYKNSPREYIVTANTPRGKSGKPLDDTRYEIVNGNKIYYKHAYSVVGFKNNVVTIENPHDSSKKVNLAISDFMKYFSQLSYVKIRADYAK